MSKLKDRRIFVLIPAYNEEASLEALVKVVDETAKSQKWNYRVILCNDGSSDKTGIIALDLAEKYPIDIITHHINRGLGETERDLFERAASLVKDDDIIIRVEGDNTHGPEYMIAMAEKIADGYDVVVASRFAEGGGQKGLSNYKSFISHSANKFMKFFFPIKDLQEYSCGFRAYRGQTIKDAIKFYQNDFIQLKGLGFTCTLEIIVKLKMLNAKFGEIPFVLRYDKKESASKMVGSVTTLGYIVMTILYHWPFGGWRTGYRKKLKIFKENA